MPETQNRKYNGKEVIEAHGYDSYDYGTRTYYPAIMRFMSMDPLAEKYYSISPYAYCANNLMDAIDPDGRKVLFVNGNWAAGIVGSIVGSNSSGASYWGKGFVGAAQFFFNDHTAVSSSNYIDGSSLVEI